MSPKKTGKYGTLSIVGRRVGSNFVGIDEGVVIDVDAEGFLGGKEEMSDVEDSVFIGCASEVVVFNVEGVGISVEEVDEGIVFVGLGLCRLFFSLNAIARFRLAFVITWHQYPHQQYSVAQIS